jgi:cytochrome c biogenesis protein CcmG/thiol:disulfide interchange protein DsbE
MSVTGPAPHGPRLWLAAIPVAIFAALALIFWKGLSGNPSELPSALIGKPVPQFALPAIDGLGVPGFDAAALKQGEVTLVNVWASWCGPCRVEHPVLMDLSKRDGIRLHGLNYKDDPVNAVQFLATLGQPYHAVGADRPGRAAVDWGVYGVPETFVIDGQGIIRYKFVGPLSPQAVAAVLVPEIEKAKKPLAAGGS